MNNTGNPFNIDYLFTKFNIKNNNKSKLAAEIIKINPNCLIPLSTVKTVKSSERKDAKNILGWVLIPLIYQIFLYLVNY